MYAYKQMVQEYFGDNKHDELEIALGSTFVLHLNGVPVLCTLQSMIPEFSTCVEKHFGNYHTGVRVGAGSENTQPEASQGSDDEQLPCVPPSVSVPDTLEWEATLEEELPLLTTRSESFLTSLEPPTRPVPRVQSSTQVSVKSLKEPAKAKESAAK